MNLGLYLYHARKYFVFALIPAIIAGTIAYFYTRNQPQIFQTTTTIYVQQGNGPVAGISDIALSQQLIITYEDMLTSPVMAQAVDQKLASKYPHWAVSGVTAGSTIPKASQLLPITVTDSNPQRAVDAANTLTSVFINNIRTLQLQRFTRDEKTLATEVANAQANVRAATQAFENTGNGNTQALVAAQATLSAAQSNLASSQASLQSFQLGRDASVNAVTVFSPATLSTTAHIGPHPTRTGLFGFSIILILAIALMFGWDYLDDSPRTPEDVEEALGAPILGTILEFDAKRVGSQLVTLQQPRSPVAEAYRLIRTNIQFTNVDSPPRTIVVTSPTASEGKSTTVANLAEVFAQGGQRVTLIDADLRRPSLHRVFEMGGRREGLTTMLVGNSLNGVGISQTDHPNLELVASGPIPPNPADLLGSHRMRGVLTHLRQHSNLVLIDSPPVLAVADAALLSTMADGVVMVIEPGRSKRRDLVRARESIESVGGKILGVVINRLAKRGGGYYYYYYSHYGYHYQYGYASTGERDTKRSSGSAGSATAPGSREGTAGPVDKTKV